MFYWKIRISFILGIILQNKTEKQTDNLGAGSEKGEDLDSAISKLDFLKKWMWHKNVIILLHKLRYYSINQIHCKFNQKTDSRWHKKTEFKSL